MKKIFASICMLLFIPTAQALMFEQKTGDLTLGVSPDTELLYTILQLAGSSDKLRTSPPSPDVTTLFAEFKGHPAVAELDSAGSLNWGKGFSYNALVEYSLCFTDLPEGRRVRDYNEELLNRVLPGRTREEKIKYLDAYWEKARDFYAKTDFAGYLEKNSGVYRGYIIAISSNLPKFDVIRMHEEYHGRSGLKFHIVPSPLSLPTGGNYGPSAGTDVYNFIGGSFDDAANVKDMVLHEFGHSFCNPVVQKSSAALAKSEFLFKGVETEMRRMAYGSWLNVMRELLVRSVHARMVLKTEGPEAAANFLRDERAKKFVFIDDFYALLDKYEKNRAKYPTLYEFYPELLAALDGWQLGEVEEAEGQGFRTYPADKGLLILNVDASKPGYAAGFRENDLVTEIAGGKPYGAFFRTLTPGKTYTITLQHKDGKAEPFSFTPKAVKVLRPVRKPASDGQSGARS